MQQLTPQIEREAYGGLGMSELRVSMIERLQTELLKSDRETFPRILGGQTTSDGLWRFF